MVNKENDEENYESKIGIGRPGSGDFFRLDDILNKIVLSVLSFIALLVWIVTGFGINNGIGLIALVSILFAFISFMVIIISRINK